MSATETLPSLMAPPPAQAELLPASARDCFLELEGQGEFTGERLHQQRPDTYKSIVVLLGQRLGVIRIGKLLGVSPNTVMAVRDREGATIDIVKEHLARVANDAATLASEGILGALNNIMQQKHNLSVRDLKELAVVYGIMVQNGQLLAGQPTSRIEVSELQKPQQPHEDFNAYLSSLKSAKATDLEGGTLGVKGAAMPGQTSGGQAARAVLEIAAATDSQSIGKGP